MWLKVVDFDPWTILTVFPNAPETLHVALPSTEAMSGHLTPHGFGGSASTA
jgi:hypothetical protein